MMKRPVAISLSPNAETDDVRKAQEVLLHPVMWSDARIVKSVALGLSDILRGSHVVMMSSGRQALYAALRALGIGKGDEVIVQAFTCIAVPASVVWTGARPIYADIRERTFNFDVDDVRSKMTGRTKAIIIQHTFGIPGPINELKQICRQRGICLVEDCAHALGGTFRERPLGTFGDISVLSFGRDKVLSSVFGGAVASKDREVVDRVRQQARELSYPSSFWIVQQLLHPVLFHAIVPLYFTANIGKLLLVAAQRLHVLSKAVVRSERQGEMPEHMAYRYSPALAHLLQMQLNKLDRYTQRRREIGDRYVHGLENANVELPIVSEGVHPAWLRFPILVDGAGKLRDRAKRSRMLLGDWYDAPLVPENCSLEAFRYEPGSCPVAERTSKRVVNLPTYPSLTDKQIREVIDFVRSYT